MGKCTNCNNWNTFVEEVKQPKEQRGIGAAVTSKTAKPMKINQIVSEKEPRVTTRMREFNRVLGGGVVPGSLEIGRASCRERVWLSAGVVVLKKEDTEHEEHCSDRR